MHTEQIFVVMYISKLSGKYLSILIGLLDYELLPYEKCPTRLYMMQSTM